MRPDSLPSDFEPYRHQVRTLRVLVGAGATGPRVIACTSEAVSGSGVPNAVSKHSHWLCSTLPTRDWFAGNATALVARVNSRDGFDTVTVCVSSGSTRR